MDFYKDAGLAFGFLFLTITFTFTIFGASRSMYEAVKKGERDFALLLLALFLIIVMIYGTYGFAKASLWYATRAYIAANG